MERWFRFVNYTLLLPFDKLNVSKSKPSQCISRLMFRRLESNQSAKTWSSLVLWFALTMVTVQLVRSLMMSFVINDDNHLLVTCFGSIFSLVYLKRRYVEVCVVHLTLVSLLYLLLVNFKWGNFFVFLTRYLDQTRNIKQQKRLYNLPGVVTKKLARQCTQYFYMEILASIAMVSSVFITGNAIICIGNPNRNNYHLFHFNPYIYYGVYSNVVSLGWATWTSCCTGPIFGIFVYFLVHMKLVQNKTKSLQIQLKRIIKLVSTRKHNDHSQIIILRRLLARHLISKNQLIEEISTTDRFWCRYLSLTQLIYRSLICYCLYIVLLSDAVWAFKLFFIWVMFSILTVLIGTITAAANVSHANQTCYPLYHQLMANAFKQNTIDTQTALKVLQNKWISINLTLSNLLCIGRFSPQSI